MNKPQIFKHLDDRGQEARFELTINRWSLPRTVSRKVTSDVCADSSQGARLAIALSAVVALALLLRVSNLLALPLWWDESIYLQWSTTILAERTRMALVIPIIDDGKQPLFMWLAAAFSYLFPEPLLAGRVVSALAGTASTVGVYLSGRWLWGDRTGLVASLLYAASPFTLIFDRMALADALLNTAGVWVFCAAVHLTSKVRHGREAAISGLALGIFLGAAIWTKMPALVMLAFPVLCGLLLLRRNQWQIPTRGLALGYALFGVFAAALALMPEASKLIDKTSSFTASPDKLLSLPAGIWWSHLVTYGDWFATYLPAPLWWLVLVAAVWGVAARRKSTLLLLACWGAFSLPTIVTAQKMYESRYLMPGVFFLQLLVADFLVTMWDCKGELSPVRQSGWFSFRRLAGAGALLMLLASLATSLESDYRLLRSPETASFTAGDREEYITGWTSGYGFPEALQLVTERTADLTRGGQQPMILITDNFHGLPLDGVKIYMRGAPNVFHYIDNHLYRDAGGFLAAWRPHQVPIVVFGNLGTDDLESFERLVPEARRIGYFPKPGGKFSFRVYELTVADLGR